MILYAKKSFEGRLNGMTFGKYKDTKEKSKITLKMSMFIFFISCVKRKQKLLVDRGAIPNIVTFKLGRLNCKIIKIKNGPIIVKNEYFKKYFCSALFKSH